MAKPLRIALIGQKFMGRAHSNAWAQAPKFFDLPREPQCELIAAKNEDELIAFAKRFGWARTSTRWQDVARDPDIDLVDLATPNFLHAPQALAMLESGKHVACEKPLASSLAEARVMATAAKKALKKGIQTFVWFNYRRCPAIATAYEMMREGRLGEIYHVRARYLQSWGGPQTPMSWRFQKKSAGSGAHGDLNAHLVDLARFLMADEIERVNGANAQTFVRERPLPDDPKKTGRSTVDDALTFLATFKSGAAASFEASRVAAGHQNRNVIEINGSKGSVSFDFEEMNVLHYHDERDGKRLGGWRRIMCTAAGEHPYAEAWWPDAHIIGYEHGFTNMAADICRVLAKKKPRLPLPDFADAYETQRVLEVALIAAKEGRSVKMSECR